MLFSKIDLVTLFLDSLFKPDSYNQVILGENSKFNGSYAPAHQWKNSGISEVALPITVWSKYAGLEGPLRK